MSPSFRTFVLEQLSRLGSRLRARSMFGGVGIYAGELFFALIDDDTLYFKVDESTRPQFVARGMRPFQPAAPAGETMQYYEVPSEVLEDTEALRSWVDQAVEVARRKRGARSGRQSSRQRKKGSKK
ncbi:MAG TPA: TfoX/Sxy family protein [Gemmatimonadales bacterium]